jgi:hypothetical protein
MDAYSVSILQLELITEVTAEPLKKPKTLLEGVNTVLHEKAGLVSFAGPSHNGFLNKVEQSKLRTINQLLSELNEAFFIESLRN